MNLLWNMREHDDLMTDAHWELLGLTDWEDRWVLADRQLRNIPWDQYWSADEEIECPEDEPCSTWVSDLQYLDKCLHDEEMGLDRWETEFMSLEDFRRRFHDLLKEREATETFLERWWPRHEYQSCL